jgi:hypothetical protein
MKRGTPRHPKTRRFADALGVSRVTAVGHLELLHHFAAELAPQGDIGKWEDLDIAAACDWPGDPVAFTDAAVRSGYVDRCAVHRLVIHDWHEHADGAVKKRLQRGDLEFVRPTAPVVESVTRQRNHQPSCESDLPGSDSVPDSVPGSGSDSVPSNGAARLPVARDTTTLDAWFESELWVVYPRKAAKKDARKALHALKPDDALRRRILENVAHRKAADPQWRDQIVPHLATYLRGERWEDEVQDRPRGAGSKAAQRERDNAAAVAAFVGGRG